MFEKIVIKSIRLLVSLFTKIENKILLISRGASGSNTDALYKARPENVNVRIIDSNSFKKNSKFLRKIKYFRELYSSRVVITTHGGPVVKKKGIIRYDFWHGLSFKGIGFTDKTSGISNKTNSFNYIDKMFSYSDMYSVLINASYHKSVNDFIVTGMPRNDFLFASKGRDNLDKIFPEIPSDVKILFYMPTYRKQKKDEYNLLRIFNSSRLDSYLESNKYVLVCKFHPNDKFEDIDFFINNKNIKLLTNKQIEKNGLDLYELLNGVDLLITDYSSVFFDLLLIDTPTLFTPFDLVEYEKEIGFVLSPYGSWICGPQVLDQKSFEKETRELIGNREYFKKERSRLKHILHKYNDEHSSQRVWDYILNNMEK